MGCFHSREHDIPSEDDSLWSDDDQDTGTAEEASAEAPEAPKETNETETTKVTEPQLA
jgi:hypothetical protein